MASKTITMININIELIPFHKDLLIPKDGRYLVRTVSSHEATIHYIHASCIKVWNKERGKFETRVDVSNQVVTHISKIQVV